MLLVKENKQFGRYVVSSIDIKKGQVVEVSPMILIRSKAEARKLHQTILNSYVYAYGKTGVAIALGVGSLFNHSETPNLTYKLKKNKMYFTATQNIPAGHQLFIDYGYSPV